MHAVMFGCKRAYYATLRLTRRKLRKMGLTAARFDLLYAIHARGEWAPIQRDLRRSLGVCASVVSRMVKSLEKLGYVRRARAHYDRRQRVVSLTDCGRARIQRAIRRFITRGYAQLALESALVLGASASRGWDRWDGLLALENAETVFRKLRDAFGDTWTDDNPAPGGHNGCDTRNDILDRDLVDKTYVSIKRCPKAVATGTLHDPYTNATVPFTRGAQIGAAVQIDHIVPLALAWDLGARNWPDDMRLRFANDPANLIAVEGQANQDKGDKEPAVWMPPNTAFRCQYAMQFIAVLRGYGLPVDAPSATALRDAADTCPKG